MPDHDDSNKAREAPFAGKAALISLGEGPDILAPARIFGVSEQLGSIEPGKVADLVIWDGDPLEAPSEPVALYVNGEPQPMQSRATQLGQRYVKRPD